MNTPTQFIQSLSEEQVKNILEIIFTVSKPENEDMLERILEDMDLSDEAIGSLLSIINQYSGSIR